MVFLKLRILIHHLVTKNEQIVENMKALDVIPLLTPEVVDKIEAVVQSKPKRTESYRWSGTGGVQSVLQGFQDLPGGILLDDIIIFHCLMFGSCFMCLGLCSWEMVSSGTLLYIHFVMWTTHLLLSVIYIPWSFPCASIHPFPAFLAGIFSDSLVSCAWTVPASSFLVTLFSCHCLPASIKDSAERVRVPRNQECFYHGPCWFFSLARFQWQAGHHVSWHAVLRNQSVSVHLGEDDSTTTTLCHCVSHISSGSEWWVVVVACACAVACRNPLHSQVLKLEAKMKQGRWSGCFAAWPAEATEAGTLSCGSGNGSGIQGGRCSVWLATRKQPRQQTKCELSHTQTSLFHSTFFLSPDDAE